MDAHGGPRTGTVRAALLYGAAWGLGEATLGHVLHLARVPGLPGLVMASFAVVIMGRLAARSSGAGAIVVAGAAAASFKFLDLLVPGTDVLALVNPIQAILLEALAGAVWVRSRMGTLLFIDNGRSRKTEASPFLKRPHFSTTDRS